MAAGPVPNDVFQPAEGVYLESSPKRIRAYLAGHAVFDTVDALLVWEHRFYPHYYIPRGDVIPGALAPVEHRTEHERLGAAERYTVRVGRSEAVDAAWCYRAAPTGDLRDRIRFDWDALDAWFEEDEQVFVHPRSPYTRVDVLDSSRDIRVDVDGVTVAHSTRARILYETGLDPRYYLPRTDVRFELLTPTRLSTSCPYKGTARYWSVAIDGTEHANVAWGYDTPLAEAIDVAGLVAFYQDRVDLFVDGQPV